MEKKNIINTIVLNGPLFFFCTAALLGIRFGGEDEGGAGISLNRTNRLKKKQPFRLFFSFAKF